MCRIVSLCLVGIFCFTLQLHAEEQHLHKSKKSAASAGEQQELKTQKDKVSYAIGVDMIRDFKRQGIEVDLEGVIKGMRESSSGAKLRMTDADMRTTLKDYNREMVIKQTRAKQETAEKNRKEGEAFLKANKAKEGVITTASGLQYKVIKAGSGKKPTAEDSVTCRYRGTLLDGTEFDSSDRMGGMPVTFTVKDSILPGWSEVLKLMPAGSKWQVFMPAELGYGEKGAAREIGPNTVLLYDIELVAVNPQAVTHPKKEATK